MHLALLLRIIIHFCWCILPVLQQTDNASNWYLSFWGQTYWHILFILLQCMKSYSLTAVVPGTICFSSLIFDKLKLHTRYSVENIIAKMYWLGMKQKHCVDSKFA